MTDDGYCTQCAELYGQPATLRGRTPRGGPSVAVTCTGCGMTTVDCTGECTGHNHGVDLRRLREHGVELHHRLKRLNLAAPRDLDTARGVLAELLEEAGYASLAEACRPVTRVVLVYDGDIAESDVAAVCATREAALRWARENPDEVFGAVDNPVLREYEVVPFRKVAAGEVD